MPRRTVASTASNGKRKLPSVCSTNDTNSAAPYKSSKQSAEKAIQRNTVKKSVESRITRLANGTLIFSDHPGFHPNLTPREMFEAGSFGGTYWREIYSGVCKCKFKNLHREGQLKELFHDIPENLLSRDMYDVDVNKFGVKCGSSLEDWEAKKWIVPQDPYGWVQWYSHFYLGRRSDDDERQIGRWAKLAGDKGRFKRQLINRMKKANVSVGDEGKISPVIAQVLQHWAYRLTKDDFE